MAKAKNPNYSEMTADELTAAAAEHRQAIRDLREKGGDDPLALELAIAEHRAHLQIINPLRSDKLAQGEFLRSDLARKARGMTRDQWGALHQVVNAPETILEGDVHTPTAKQG